MELDEIKKRMHGGKLYCSMDETLLAEQLRRIDRLYDYNATRPTELLKRTELLKELFDQVGEGCYFEPPLRANWGGKHVRCGNYVYANFNLTLVDDTYIEIGDHVMIGPNVCLCTAAHPIHTELRKKQGQYNLPVKICSNVWIGAGAVVLPGITIGENSVIGAGSIVTRDIPPNVVAVGNPCRVMRPITARDHEYYDHDRLIDLK